MNKCTKRLMILFICSFFLMSCQNNDENTKNNTNNEKTTHSTDKTDNSKTDVHTEDKIDAAVNFSKDFVNRLYEIDPTNTETNLTEPEQIVAYSEKFDPYLTEEAFDDLSTNRVLIRPLQLFEKRQETMTIEDFSVDEESVSEEDNAIKFSYSFTLMFTNDNGDETDDVELTVDTTLEGDSASNDFKISRYYERGFPVEKLMEEDLK